MTDNGDRQDPHRIRELQLIRLEVSDEFCQTVVQRISEQDQVDIVVEFVLVGWVLTLSGFFGLDAGSDNDAEGVTPQEQEP